MTRGLRVCAVVLPALLALAGVRRARAEVDAEATAEPAVSVSVVNTLTAQARMDNANGKTGDDGFGFFLDRLNVAGTTERASLSLRLDSVGVAEKPAPEGFADDLRLERATGELRLGETTLTVGDMYRQLGRGILLSLRKVDEIGLDVLLRGAEARWAPEGHALSAFGGVVNSVNVDTVTGRFMKDTGDVLAGVSYELSAVEGLTLGLNAVHLQPAERLIEDLDYKTSAGATLELPEVLSGLSLYGELAVQNRQEAGKGAIGTAAYLTADLSLGDLALLVEGLRIVDFDQKGSRNSVLASRFDYNLPPTLDRIDQEVTASNDVTGGRVRGEVAWLDGAFLTHANLMVRVNDLGQASELMQLHAYAGAEVRFEERASKVAVSGGYRDERNDAGQVKSLAHLELDVVKSLATAWSLHLSSSNELRTLLAEDYARGSTYLGADWAGRGSLTFELGYDTQNPQPEIRHWFFAGILGLDLSEVVRARVTAGTQRGGLKCIAGNCRNLPPFAGVGAEVVLRL